MSITKVSWNTKAGKQIRWRVELPAEDGKRVTKTFRTKALAREWETEQLYLRNNQTGPQTDDELLFADLVEQWFTDHVSKRTEATQQRYSEIMRHHVLPDLGDLVACEITPQDVARWFRKLQASQNLSVKGKNMALGRLKGVLNWAIKAHYLLYNPATATEPIPSDEEHDFDYWTGEEVSTFLAATQDDHHYPLYVTALNTGMRQGELIGLQRDRVDLRRRVIRVNRTWCNKANRLKNTTKGKRSRSVPINDMLAQVLAEQLLRNPGDCPWVFPCPEGRRTISEKFCVRVFKPTCEAAGVRAVRFHDLRHTYASHFVMNGGDIYRLQKILGHHSVTVTEMYAHLAPDYLQDAADIVSFGGCRERGSVVDLAAVISGAK